MGTATAVGTGWSTIPTNTTGGNGGGSFEKKERRSRSKGIAPTTANADPNKRTI